MYKKRRIRALDISGQRPGPDNSGSTKPTASVIMAIKVLSMSNKTPDRRQPLDGLRQALQATFPANSAKPTSNLPQRPRVTMSEKSAPRRDGLVA